jgi:hypothetical protein
VENNLVVAGIILVTVLQPLKRRSMDFNIATERGAPKLDRCIAEIWPTPRVKSSHLDDTQGSAINGLQRRMLEILPAPDMTKKPLVDVAYV